MTINALFPISIRKLDDYIKDLDKCTKAAKTRTELIHMEEAKEHQQKVSRQRKEEIRRCLLKLLPEVDIMTKHDMTSCHRHPDTATWIFEDPAFRGFDDSRRSACLCCYGILDSGKTYLASSLIDQAMLGSTEQDELVVYHYFDYMDKRSLSVSALLSAF